MTISSQSAGTDREAVRLFCRFYLTFVLLAGNHGSHAR
jgi:hypothetical protein